MIDGCGFFGIKSMKECGWLKGCINLSGIGYYPPNIFLSSCKQPFFL